MPRPSAPPRPRGASAASSPAASGPNWSLYHGDMRAVLAALPENSVHCVVTSPPYFGLRVYKGVEPTIWGGDPACEHDWAAFHHSAGGGQPGDKVRWQHTGKGPSGHPKLATSFCSRCGAWRGVLGNEPTLDLYVAHIVECFRAVRRVMRDDAVLWLNLGDTFYAGKGEHGSSKARATAAERGYHQSGGTVQVATRPQDRPMPGLKPGDLMGVPWRCALALQADGWYLRSPVVWAKGLSFCPSYSGSAMPESVSGWAWKRQRIITEPWKAWRHALLLDAKTQAKKVPEILKSFILDHPQPPKWADCPGCPTCTPNGGYVLRKGSWRPTSSYDMLFMLTKTDSYFCDKEAVKESALPESTARCRAGFLGNDPDRDKHRHQGEGFQRGPGYELTSRNLRSVWTINPQRYPGAHYATFPEALVEPCIKVSTSPRGCCPQCGSPWARVLATTRSFQSGSGQSGNPPAGKHGPGVQGGGETGDIRRGPCLCTETLGWRPTCSCSALSVPPRPRGASVASSPCLVLDPFCGSGTTGVVALRHNCAFVGIDASRHYLLTQARRALALWQQGRPTRAAKRHKKQQSLSLPDEVSP